MRNGTTGNSMAISPIKIMRLVLYAVIFLCGVLGNMLVIIVVKGRGKKRTFHDFFLLNLAVADLLFILCLPADMYLEVSTFPFTDFYCKILYPLTTFAFSLSVFTLTSMAIGRCYIMQHTTKPPLKGRAALLWIVILWITSLACVLPLTIIARSAPNECQEDWSSHVYRKTFTASLLVLQYIAPLVIIAIAYINIGLLLIKTKAPQSMNNNKSQSLALRIRHRNLQITRTLAVIVVLFALLMLPHEIAWMLMDFGSSDDEYLVGILIKFSPILTYLHSCSNPLVYGLMTSQFRTDVKKYVCWCARSGLHSDSENDERSPLDKKTGKKSLAKKVKFRSNLDTGEHALETSHALGYAGKVNVIVYFSPKSRRTKSRIDLEKSEVPTVNLQGVQETESSTDLNIDSLHSHGDKVAHLKENSVNKSVENIDAPNYDCAQTHKSKSSTDLSKAGVSDKQQKQQSKTNASLHGSKIEIESCEEVSTVC